MQYDNTKVWIEDKRTLMRIQTNLFRLGYSWVTTGNIYKHETPMGIRIRGQFLFCCSRYERYMDSQAAPVLPSFFLGPQFDTWGNPY